MNDNIVLGVDIGGSHITAALVDTGDGTIVAGSIQREKIDSAEGADHIIQAWSTVMTQSLRFAGNSGKIAIAMPGPFDYQNGISYMKSMGKYDALYGMNVRDLLCAQLSEGITEIHFINDAGCFLQGEVSHGPAADYQEVVGFTLGTGFGSAIAKGGLALDADYWCYPFMGGICEDFFSSRWFVSTYNKYSGLKVNNVKELICDVELGGPLLQVFDEFSMNMGVFLTQLYKKHKFDCVVFGGNIAKASSLFLPQLKYYLKTMAIAAPVYISSKGETAALIGASCSIVH
ncbi:ROK family protein [Pedobacter agri]|uniref:ROK family protein n=1 Tax=Pedobacter agri TaxID=454586 RepID=UPI0029310A72|nr:ROK family protein [Pedobacter agri]